MFLWQKTSDCLFFPLTFPPSITNIVKKILFPTEFADHAGHMFRYALEIAHIHQAELIAMHAFGRPEGYAIGDEEAKRERVMTKLQTLARENTPEGYDDVSVRFAAEVEYPGDAILDIADKENVDLIVLGMTGKSDDIHRHLGSNALRVIRSADCPVLAIPSSATFQAVKEIVFTTDFEFDDLLVLHFLHDTFNAHISVVHVVEKNRDRAAAERNMDALRRTFSQFSISFDVLEDKDVEEAIEQFVAAKEANLLAMTSHRRSVIGLLLDNSTTRNIAKQTKTPLLVFKTK